MNRKGKKIEEFLNYFGITWIVGQQYIKDFKYIKESNVTSGIKVTPVAMRMIEEFYHSLGQDVVKVQGVGYYPLSVIKKCIKRIDEIVAQINLRPNHEEKVDFEQAVRPLMRFLAETHHPHTKVIVESNRAELVEGLKIFNTSEYIKD